MDRFIPFIAVMCFGLGVVAILYFWEVISKPQILSTYTFDFEIAKEKFENTRQMFMANNPNLYWKLMKIELNCGWDFYYKIERKKKRN